MNLTFSTLITALKRVVFGAPDDGTQVVMVSGTGSPEGVVSAQVGSTYLRKFGGPNLSLYLKEAGGVGNTGWIPVTTDVSPEISVADEAALTAFDTTALLDGARGYVASHRSFWTLRTQVLTLQQNEIIASFQVATRQWVRETDDQHMSWAFTYSTATPVFVDPLAAASANERDGLTAGTALQNIDEVWRRLPVLVNDLRIVYTGTGSPAVVTCSPQIRYLSALSAPATIEVVIDGVITAGVLPVGATGILASSTNVAGNTPPQITDTGGAGIVWVRGTLLEIVAAGNPATVGARSFVEFNEGGGLASVGVWFNAAGTAPLAPADIPVAGNTYRVITLTNAPDLLCTGPTNVTINNVRVTGWRQCAGFGPVTPSVTLRNCSLEFGAFAPLSGSSIVTTSTFVRITVILIANGVLWNTNGVSFDRVGAVSPLRVTYGGRMTCANGYIQSDAVTSGLAISGTFAVDGVGGGFVLASNFGVRGVGTSAAIQVRKGGKLNVIGPLWGAGNATIGTQVVEGGQMYVLSTQTPTLAAAITELAIGTIATPATWPAWVAAGRNAADASVNSAVLDAA